MLIICSVLSQIAPVLSIFSSPGHLGSHPCDPLHMLFLQLHMGFSFVGIIKYFLGCTLPLDPELQTAHLWMPFSPQNVPLDLHSSKELGFH